MVSKVLLTHPGTQYAHRLACQLKRVDILDKFVTGVAFASDSRFLKFMPESLLKKISNRILDCGISEDQIKRILMPELLALYNIRQGRSIPDIMHERNRRFQKDIRTSWINSTDAVIGFDTASWILAQKAKESSKPFFLDQSTIHPKEKISVVNYIRAQFPDWSTELPEKSDALMAIEDQEHALSPKIVVASTFTKMSLVRQGVQEQKIAINPYGVASNFFRKRNAVKRSKLRFIYLGVMGAAKGVPLLLQLWKEYRLHERAELWLVGQTPNPFDSTLLDIEGVTYKGKVPHRDLPALLDECDCMVFPSFFDGFGQVILEAMAMGIPVITTTSTGGPDVIENGKDGFIVETGDKKALASVMKEVIEDPARIQMMSGLTQEKARMFSWESYGDRWKKILNSL